MGVAKISFKTKSETKAKTKAKANPSRLFDSKYSDWSSKISSIFPKLNLNHDYCQLFANFMVIIAILAALPLTIQLLKVIRTKEVEGISLYAFILQIFIYLSWFCYAIICINGILIISSSLGFTVASLLVYFVWKYRRNP